MISDIIDKLRRKNKKAI